MPLAIFARQDVTLCHVPTYPFFFFFFLTGAAALIQAVFGEGTGRIWLDSVQCTGSERALTNCTSSSSGNNSCTHEHDAEVRCLSGMVISVLAIRGGGGIWNFTLLLSYVVKKWLQKKALFKSLPFFLSSTHPDPTKY